MKRLVVVGALGVLVLVLIAWLALRKLGAGGATPAAAETVEHACGPQPAEEIEAAATAAQLRLAKRRGRVLDSNRAPLAA